MTQATAAAILQPVWGAKPLTADQKMQNWLDKRKALEDAKNAEMAARLDVVAQFFPNPEGKKEGTVNVPLANGYKLKIVLKQNYRLASTGTDSALTAYEHAAGTPEEAGRRALETERLVKWKPELSISEYREASPELLKAIESVLTISDGSPAVELVEPKK